MTEVTDRIKKMIVERLNLRIQPSDIQDSVPLFGDAEAGLGLDSIDALDLAVGLFEEFQVEVSQDDLEHFASIESMAKFVLTKREAAGEVVSV